MEPNFQIWLEETEEYEQWTKDMVKAMDKAYQEYLEQRKSQLAEHYGN